MGLEDLRRDLGLTGIEALRRDLEADAPDVGPKKGAPSAFANLKNLPKLITEGIPAAGRAAWARATDPTPTMGQELATAAPWLPIVPAVQDIISRAGRVLSAPGAAVAELGPERAKPLTEALANVAMGGRGARRAFAGAPPAEMPPPAPSLPRSPRPEPPASPAPPTSPAPSAPPAAPVAPPSGRPSAPMDVFGLEMDKSRAPMPPPAPGPTPSPEIALRDYAAPGGTKVVQKIGDEMVTWTKTDRNEWQGWYGGAHRKLTGESALNLAANPPAPSGPLTAPEIAANKVSAPAAPPQPPVAPVQRPVAPPAPPRRAPSITTSTPEVAARLDALGVVPAKPPDVGPPALPPMGERLPAPPAQTAHMTQLSNHGGGVIMLEFAPGSEITAAQLKAMLPAGARTSAVYPLQPSIFRPPGSKLFRIDAMSDLRMSGKLGDEIVESLGGQFFDRRAPTPYVPPPDVGPVARPRFEATPEGMQGVIGGTPAPAMPQRPLKAPVPQQAPESSPLFGQERAARSEATDAAQTRLEMGGRQQANVNEWVMDQLGGTYGIALTRAKSPEAIQPAVVAKLKSLGIDPVDAWHATHAEVPPPGVLDRLAQLSVPKPALEAPKPPDVGLKRTRAQKRGLWEDTGSPDLNDPEHMAALVQGYGKLRTTADRAGEMRDIPSYFKKKDGLAPQQMAQAILEDYPHLLGGDVKAVEDKVLDVLNRYVSLRRDKAAAKAKEKASFDVESSVTGKRVSGKLAPEDTVLKQEMDWWTKLMLLLGTGTGARLGWPRKAEGT